MCRSQFQFQVILLDYYVYITNFLRATAVFRVEYLEIDSEFMSQSLFVKTVQICSILNT
jgi:hypothetical protein